MYIWLAGSMASAGYEFLARLLLDGKIVPGAKAVGWEKTNKLRNRTEKSCRCPGRRTI